MEKNFLLCTLIIVCIYLKFITLGFTLHSGELFRLNPSGFVQVISFADRLNVQLFSDSPYLLRRQSPHSRQRFFGLGCYPLQNKHCDSLVVEAGG